MAETYKLFEDVVGAGNAAPDSVSRFDGLAPSLLVKPGSADEAAECLKVCSRSNLAVVAAGAVTWIDCGNPVARADVILCLERMNRILEHSPPDLTATVEAGVTLSAFNRETERARQWLPFDPPGASVATLGAIVACNSSGPLRCGLGTPRDYTIGLRLAHADGSQSKSGGKVVKNVAGYDMNKLYVGSFGTLAVITEITYKLRPMPESIATAIIVADGRGTLSKIASVATGSDLQPASIALTNLRLGDIFGTGFGAESLLLRFADSEPAVEHQLDCIDSECGEGYRTAVLRGGDDAKLWERVAEIDSDSAFAAKMSLPLSKTLRAYEKVAGGSVAAADLGTGTIRVAWDGSDEAAVSRIEELRAYAETNGGPLFVERATASVKRRTDAWGSVGTSAPLMKLIKEKFDPGALLNPGRFVAGI